MKIKHQTFAVIISLILLTFFVTAVQAEDNNYVDNGDGTVTDLSTSLMWQQATAPGTYLWQQAFDYCDNLTIGGHSDWRLPTPDGLMTLVDTSFGTPTIDTSFFPDTQTSYYRTSVGYPDDSFTQLVNFERGKGAYSTGAAARYVRAVRTKCNSLGNTDFDTVCNDGDGNGTPGDNPCTDEETILCDDNCPNDGNPDQEDVDNDDIGDACDPDTIYGNITGDIDEHVINITFSFLG